MVIVFMAYLHVYSNESVWKIVSIVNKVNKTFGKFSKGNFKIKRKVNYKTLKKSKQTNTYLLKNVTRFKFF